MEQFVIKGPVHLKGNVAISGSKNASLPIISACILFSDEVRLKNIPKIKDVLTLLEILETVGITSSFCGNELIINPKGLINSDPDKKKIRNLRASILLVTPLLVRNKKISLPHPGGCLIGSRPIDVHLTALSKMGATITTEDREYRLSAEKLNPGTFFADFSVTGTENIIMATVLSEGTSYIKLAAAEPHVQDLCNFLNAAGANIKGVGTHTLSVTGVKKLKSVQYEIIPDQIEAGTFAIAAAASKGEVTVEGFIPEHHESLLSKFDQANISYEILANNKIKMIPTYEIKPFKVRTEIYPGFPTDLQAPLAVLATQALGTTEIYETIFEGRLGYINELSKMGASCVIRDAHQATITGPAPLFGTRITSFDLRAGATLIIAALIAQGESRLDQIEIIDRGYENIEEKFRQLGANIKRVKLAEIEEPGRI